MTRARAVDAMRAAYSPEFLEFWAAYPRRVGKGAAWAVFERLQASPADLDRMLEALVWQVRQPGWREAGGQYIPHPATWLHQRRWEDEPVEILRASVLAWVCPHEPACEARHYCELKLAKAAAGL